MGFTERVLVFFQYLLIILFLPIMIFLIFTLVMEYETIVVFRLGKLRKLKNRPGLVFYLPLLEDIVKIDMRWRSFNVDPQEVLTKDHVSVYVDAIIFYRVINSEKAVMSVNDYERTARELAATSLRGVLGMVSFTELLSKRAELSRRLTYIIDEIASSWGVNICLVEITDIRLPHEMQRAMAKEAEAERDARANIAFAEGELTSSSTLHKASQIISKNPVSIQLKYLQTAATIATEKKSTIVFPVPLSMDGTFHA